jgi:AcrR family transcriptional regulator
VKENPRRTTILEAASRLFEHYGPFKTTVADIARAANVGIGTVYLEFRSKDDILSALSWTRHQRVLVAVETAWGDGTPAAERICCALDARVDALLGCVGDRAHAADLFASRCPPIEEARGMYESAELALFTRFLQVALERRELAITDPEGDARAILLAYRAFEPPHVFAIARETRERDLRRLHQLVLSGLLPR